MIVFSISTHVSNHTTSSYLSRIHQFEPAIVRTSSLTENKQMNTDFFEAERRTLGQPQDGPGSE